MCILVVEDEPLIRMLVAEELAVLGFEVREVSSGDQAAVLIHDPEIMFSLLVTDLHMPERHDGLAIADMMRQRHPTVPIIYMTARPDILQTRRQLGEREKLLCKPFTLAKLVETADRALANLRDFPAS